MRNSQVIEIFFKESPYTIALS